MDRICDGAKLCEGRPVLGRLGAHAANACLTLDVGKSETGALSVYSLELEAFAISRLIAPILFCRANRLIF